MEKMISNHHTKLYLCFLKAKSRMLYSIDAPFLPPPLADSAPFILPSLQKMADFKSLPKLKESLPNSIKMTKIL